MFGIIYCDIRLLALSHFVKRQVFQSLDVAEALKFLVFETLQSNPVFGGSQLLVTAGIE
jgi:hypothetical protein